MEGTRQQRRLATILAADVAGYSRLMAQDEEATVRTLRAFREVMDRLIDRHEGRIFNTGGDSVLAEFGSAVEAVRCAIAIQDELRVRNAELVADRRMQFRIGINVGDVLIQGDDLLGDGINVAARLESLAQPGGICISGSTFEQVKNKLSVGFHDLGPQQVKNIPEPVHAFGLTAAPVAVVGEAGAPAGGATAKAAGITGRTWILAAVAAVAIVVIVGGIALWRTQQAGPLTFASLPETVSSDQLHAHEIAALMTGVTISGTRLLDGQPFTILLNADKSASYAFGRAGAPSGTMEHLMGMWRAEDSRFCMQIPQFGRGRELCPRITKNGTQLSAISRRDGAVLPWTLTR